MKHPQAHRSSPAFTLLELLASIAIIAVLAALLIPGMQSIRARVDSATCMSNMKNVGQAILMSTGDNGVFPPLTDVGEIKSWPNSIVSYFGANPSDETAKFNATLKNMRCPPIRKVTQVLQGKSGERNLNIHGLRNFAMNSFLGPTSVDTNAWRTMASVVKPSQTMLLSEAGIQDNGNCMFQLDIFTIGRSTLDASKKLMPGVHGPCNNIFWVDGHISSWKDITLLQKVPYRDGGTQDVWTGR